MFRASLKNYKLQGEARTDTTNLHKGDSHSRKKEAYLEQNKLFVLQVREDLTVVSWKDFESWSKGFAEDFSGSIRNSAVLVKWMTAVLRLSLGLSLIWMNFLSFFFTEFEHLNSIIWRE